MIPEFWTTRSEAYLAKILGETVEELPTPEAPVDLFLAKIAGMDVETPVPRTRYELYLAAILGQAVALPIPQGRADFYLAAVAGMDVETPDPQTRIDFYLAAWAEESQSSVTIGPAALLSFMANKARPIDSLSVALEPIQSGTGDPSPDNVRPISGHSAVNVFIEPECDPDADPTATISLGTTVYEGNLNVTTGVLTVTWVGYKINAYNWTYFEDGGYFRANPGERKRGITNIICECYATSSKSSASSMENNRIKGAAQSKYIYVKDSRFTDKDTFVSAMGDYLFVFERETPQTVQLTGEQLQTLANENHVWTDAGEVTLSAKGITPIE